MNFNTLTIASLSAALAVGLGAFGAHGLEPFLTENFSLNPSEVAKQITNWKTAAHYHLIHSIGLVLCFIIANQLNHSAKRIRITQICFIVGSILFSGSLYTLVVTQIKILGAIVPLGGLSFIAGWLALASASLARHK